MQDAATGQDGPGISEIGPIERLRVAIVGTPRSGNTWLRHLLARALGLREVGFPFPEDVEWDTLPDRCALQVHGYPTEGFLGDLDRHGFRVVVPSRHPLDVLISLLSFATQRFDPGLPGGGVGEVELPIVGVSPRDPAFLDYATRPGDDSRMGISAAWWGRPGVARVRYEDLVAETASELARLVSELGQEPRTPIAEVVARGRLDRMRRDETFRGWPHHFFQGTPGLWRTVLPAAEARTIAGAHRELFETCGYPCDPDESLDPRQADLTWFRLQAEASRRFSAQERANNRQLRADLGHEVAGHEKTREAYRNAIDQVHRVCHLLYDERVSADLIRKDAEHWRARAEAAEIAARAARSEALGLRLGRLKGMTLRTLELLRGAIRKPGTGGALTAIGGAPIVAGNPPSTPDLVDSPTPGRSPHGPSRHLVHRPVGRPDAGGHLPEGRPMGLRRHRASLLGRPLQRPEGPER